MERMQRLAFIGIALLALLLLASDVCGQGGGTRPADRGRWIERCAAGSPEAEEAVAALAAVSGQIEVSDAAAELPALQLALDRLRPMKCFLATEEWLFTDDLRFDDLAQLKVWWEEGGYDWLRHLAEGTAPGAPVVVVLPPSRRETLLPARAPADHVLRSLACPEGELECGRETAGWALRAEAAFEAHARRERELDAERDGGGAAESPERACRRRARAERPERRYVEWLDCVDAARPTVGALPAGRIRAPSTGALVVRGRRGHYAFCDEERKYDLATGATRVTRSCGSLVLRTGGSVDPAATRATRRRSERAGWVPVDAIREVAWMLLLSDRVDSAHAPWAAVELPAGIVPRFRADAERTSRGLSLGGWGWSSAQTTLRWEWRDETRTLAQGHLRWPDASSPEEDHAAALLRIAEAAITLEPPGPSRPGPAAP